MGSRTSTSWVAHLRRGSSSPVVGRARGPRFGPTDESEGISHLGIAAEPPRRETYRPSHERENSPGESLLIFALGTRPSKHTLHGALTKRLYFSPPLPISRVLPRRAGVPPRHHRVCGHFRRPPGVVIRRRASTLARSVRTAVLAPGVAERGRVKPGHLVIPCRRPDGNPSPAPRSIARLPEVARGADLRQMEMMMNPGRVPTTRARLSRLGCSSVCSAPPRCRAAPGARRRLGRLRSRRTNPSRAEPRARCGQTSRRSSPRTWTSGDPPSAIRWSTDERGPRSRSTRGILGLFSPMLIGRSGRGGVVPRLLPPDRTVPPHGSARATSTAGIDRRIEVDLLTRSLLVHDDLRSASWASALTRLPGTGTFYVW
jgi:hypothetical protein